MLDDLPVDTVLYIKACLHNSEHTPPWSASFMTRIFDFAIFSPTAFRIYLIATLRSLIKCYYIKNQSDEQRLEN